MCIRDSSNRYGIIGSAARRLYVACSRMLKPPWTWFFSVRTYPTNLKQQLYILGKSFKKPILKKRSSFGRAYLWEKNVLDIYLGIFFSIDYKRPSTEGNDVIFQGVWGTREKIWFWLENIFTKLKKYLNEISKMPAQIGRVALPVQKLIY